MRPVLLAFPSPAGQLRDHETPAKEEHGEVHKHFETLGIAQV
jgi:hypothetical protein